MKSVKDIKQSIRKLKVESSDEIHDRVLDKLLRVLDKSKRQTAVKQPNIWRIIIKSRITKLAAAAVITIAVIIGIKGFNGTTAWAEVVKAFKAANNIHLVGKRSRSTTGEVEEFQWWIKNGNKMRTEYKSSTLIDDGTRRLLLLHQEKVARLSESESGVLHEWPLLQALRGEETEFPTETKLIGEIENGLMVYEVKEYIFSEELIIITNAWVDPHSNLPMRVVGKQIDRETGKTRVTFEATCDYQPIPPDMFSLVVPPDYTQLPSRFFSGKVMNEKGEPVAGAEVITSNDDVKGKTNESGEFAIKLHPGRTLWGFPMIIRAIISDDPNHVAWTLLRNPKHELRPLFRPDDGKTRLEQGGDVDIVLVDERKLLEFIPHDPGKMIFKNETDLNPSEVRDIVLKIAPASVITGRITDHVDIPIANAIVKIEYIKIVVGENEIEIRDLGRMDKEKEMISSLNVDGLRSKTFTVTDKNGFYALANLPDVWHKARLEVKADGYVTEAKEIFQEERCNFTLLRADITIRGTVVDNHGAPLLGREVNIDVDSDLAGDFDIEEAIIDSEGRFELTGVPVVDGLELEIRTDEKPRDWEENELTRGCEFIYYKMIEVPIELESGKKEYFVKITPHRPDITIEIEVKDSEGNLLEDIPVGICSPGFSEREWYLIKLAGKTDNNGICTIIEAPIIEPLQLWICEPGTNSFQDWENLLQLSQELKNAIKESRKKYPPMIVVVELEQEKKKYKIPVVLQAIKK